MSILQRYQNTRQRTEVICTSLTVEDYIPQPVVFASPPKWHIAHTTWFFEEMILKKHYADYKEFDASFGFLFNSYYNSIGERTIRADRGNITRPGVAEVYEYRSYVDKHMTTLLEETTNKTVLRLTILGINHEQQHQELLMTDLKYSLGHNPIFPVYHTDSNLVNDTNSKKGFVSIDDGIYSIGHRGEGYHFDNELGRHKVYLHAFEIAKGLVTNGEFMEFMEAGAY
jgi:ergothioneine biosynthesis protein EgtB